MPLMIRTKTGLKPFTANRKPKPMRWKGDERRTKDRYVGLFYSKPGSAKRIGETRKWFNDYCLSIEAITGGD